MRRPSHRITCWEVGSKTFFDEPHARTMTMLYRQSGRRAVRTKRSRGHGCGRGRPRIGKTRREAGLIVHWMAHLQALRGPLAMDITRNPMLQVWREYNWWSNFESPGLFLRSVPPSLPHPSFACLRAVRIISSFVLAVSFNRVTCMLLPVLFLPKMYTYD